MSAIGKPLLSIIRNSVPVPLFRMQSARAVSLRDYAVATAAGRRSYDLHLVNGVASPSDLSGGLFLGPNGMSMRPKGTALAMLLAGFHGRCSVWEVPAGTPIPPELILLHEHTDHYALQPAQAMPLVELNKRLTSFLAQAGVVVSSRKQLYERHPDLEPHAHGFSENA